MSEGHHIRKNSKNCCYKKRQALKQLKIFIKSCTPYICVSVVLLFVFYNLINSKEVLKKIEHYSEVNALTVQKGNAVFKKYLKKNELSVKAPSAINSDIKRCDFALESLGFLKSHLLVDSFCSPKITVVAFLTLGGKILSIRFSKPYSIPGTCLFQRLLQKIKNLLPGSIEKARVILQPSIDPGNCWTFDGSKGSVIIRLYGKVYISAVTLQHISANISPLNEITSAPKEFSVKGLTSVGDSNGHNFGKFTYDIDGSTNQYFEVNNKAKRSYNIIQFDFHSNWGNNYTCVYRIQVHGTLDKNK